MVSSSGSEISSSDCAVAEGAGSTTVSCEIGGEGKGDEVSDGAKRNERRRERERDASSTWTTGERKRRKTTHLHPLPSFRIHHRVPNKHSLESVQSRSLRSLELHRETFNLSWNEVGNDERLDDDSIGFDVPDGCPVAESLILRA